jgi:hypothetical protein
MDSETGSVTRLTNDLLSIWQIHHGRLEDRWKQRFLEHPDLARLVQFPRRVAIESVKRHQRLEEAVSYAATMAPVEPGESAPDEGRRHSGDAGKTRHLLDVVALYEEFLSESVMSNEDRANWINNPTTHKMVGYSGELLIAAAIRCTKPLTAEGWLLAARAEENRRRRPAGSVLDGRSDLYDHRPTRPGGSYSKGDF